MNILIAEGESSTASGLRTILGKIGHKVVAVTSSGEEAVEKA